MPPGDLLAQIRVLLVHAPNAEHGTHPGHELDRIEGLGHVLVGPLGQTSDQGVGLGEGGHHDDGDEVGGLAVFEAPADLVPVHAGHHDVEKDEIRLLVLEDFEGLCSVGRLDDLVAIPGESGPQGLDIGRVIVDDEDLGHVCHGTAGSGPEGEQTYSPVRTGHTELR